MVFVFCVLFRVVMYVRGVGGFTGGGSRSTRDVFPCVLFPYGGLFRGFSRATHRFIGIFFSKFLRLERFARGLLCSSKFVQVFLVRFFRFSLGGF